MAELQDIMNSGDLQALLLDTLSVKPSIQALQTAVTNIDNLVNNELAQGIPLPQIPAADATENRVFFNIDNNRVCWKAPGGLVFRFRMQLI